MSEKSADNVMQGMQVLCTLHLTGQKAFIEVPRKQLSSVDGS